MNKTKRMISFVKEKISILKQRIGTKFKTLKSDFKDNYNEVKSQPISKRRSALLGFTTVLSIFGLVLFTPQLSAFAKDIPKKGNGSGVSPSPSPTSQPSPGTMVPSKETGRIITGAAASLCAMAVGSGSFLVGIICGAVVAGGIIYVQRNL